MIYQEKVFKDMFDDALIRKMVLQVSRGNKILNSIVNNFF